MADRRTGNREVALTTLIDLLVQVIFVFTLILIASEGIEGAPKERGWVTPEVWKILLSIFDIDARKLRDTDQQAEEMKKKYTIVRDQLEKAKVDLEKCRSRLTDIEGRLAGCEKQTGRGPGYPTCRDKDGEEMVVIDAVIDREGNISVTPLGQAAELRGGKPLTERAFSTPLSPDRFRTAYVPWRQSGLARDPACAYKAKVSYDPRAQAGKYEPARRAIAGFFSLAGAPRQFEP